MGRFGRTTAIEAAPLDNLMLSTGTVPIALQIMVLVVLMAAVRGCRCKNLKLGQLLAKMALSFLGGLQTTLRCLLTQLFLKQDFTKDNVVVLTIIFKTLEYNVVVFVVTERFNEL